MMKTPRVLRQKSLFVALAIIAGIFLIFQSCRKEPIENNSKKQQYSILSGPLSMDQSWINLRNQTRVEFDFHFGEYYHKRDYLGSVDWDQAILSEKDGHRVMVFKFNVNDELQTDARLMVVQGDGGRNTYSLKITSKETKYTSLYSANDKMMYVGKVENGIFNILGQTKFRGNIVTGTSICQSCHNGDDDYEDPVPGDGGGLSGNNWLDEVVIVDQAPADPVFIPDYPNGPFIIIPGDDNNTDPNPCAAFNSLMSNPQFREKLQQLINNTTLSVETAFTFDGVQFSPFAQGSTSNPQVDYDIFTNTIFDGHSHYSGLAPTFTPGDLLEFYARINFVGNFMGYVSVVATPYGTYMLKLVDQNAFNAFANTYLSSAAAVSSLADLYNDYGITNGTNSGDNLQNLFNDKNAGLRIIKIENPNSPTVNCN